MADLNANHDQLPEDADFGDLIRAARTGDVQARGRLVQQCRDYLLLIANRGLGRDVQAKVGPSDVVQETLVTAQAKLDQFEGDSKAEFLAWIRTILSNDLLETHRRFRGVKKRDVERESLLHSVREAAPTDTANTPATDAAIREEMDLLERHMADLPYDYQQVLRLRNWQGLSFPDIGQQMGRSAEAARKLWARALMKLQETMHQD